MRSPVLLLVFNRPDTTARVFDAIRTARPTRLYVAADGPRRSRPAEFELCEQTRRIATAIDWPCELTTLLREENLGCKRAVSSAISWFFDREPEGIVLEDDCLPDPSFFAYCDAMLERYRADHRVMCVSGDNFIAGHWQPEHSYYFSRYAHIWGWASWARAWKHYDVDLKSPGNEPVVEVVNRTFPKSANVRAHWLGLLTQITAGRIDTWDYQWAYTLWRCNGLSCMPRVNLISNIGFGPGATHTVSAESKLAGLAAGTMVMPLNHPATVACSDEADAWTEADIFEIGSRNLRWQMAGRAVGRLRSALGRLGSGRGH